MLLFYKMKLFFCTVVVALLFGVATSEGVQAPDFYRVHFKTDIEEGSPIVVEVNRSWAPIGADHFYKLVQENFYDNSALFRVVPNFVLQFPEIRRPHPNAKNPKRLKGEPL